MITKKKAEFNIMFLLDKIFSFCSISKHYVKFIESWQKTKDWVSELWDWWIDLDLIEKWTVIICFLIVLALIILVFVHIHGYYIRKSIFELLKQIELERRLTMLPY